MKIHFTGIAGAGMAAVAQMMQDAGHEVSGSDQDVFPPMSTFVEGLGLPVAWRLDAANLPGDLDVLVQGASAKLGGDDNVEARTARERGVRVTTFPELVGDLTRDRVNTVVAGSFGKSTCAALAAHVLRSCRVDAGWLVGAISPSLPATGRWGTSPEMILEGDEYIVGPDDRRSKFALYHPQRLLLTSLVHDHVNVFPTFAEYEAPFRELLRGLPADGLAVLRDHPAVREVAGETRARIVWYGGGEGGWRAQGEVFGDVTRFDLVAPDGACMPMTTGLLGAHNIENIVGVSALLLETGLVECEGLVRAVASFEGIRRRLDRLTRTSRIPVIEGFGSSWEKARSAIDALRLHFPDRRLVVVFEPHTFSWRSRDALSWYDTVFEGVDQVLVLPPPDHGAGGHNQSTLAEIVDRTRAAGVDARPVSSAAEAQVALSALSGDEVVLLLSSGPLLGLPDSLPQVFDRLYGT
jgi:UDP-N-acetylmuramate: L-alanyl-gamma-D-glutamyl-meso-diaminopimelate ligase